MTECNEQEMLGVEGGNQIGGPAHPGVYGIILAFGAGYAIGTAIYDAYAEEIGDAIDAVMAE